MVLVIRPEAIKNARQMSLISNEMLPTEQQVQRFRKAVLTWFSVHKRDFLWRQTDADSYLKIVSEVLLQRTRAEVVSSFLPLFLNQYPNWSSLAQADKFALGELLKPLGLWQRRTVSLSGLAKNIVDRQEVWPGDRADLESIQAVGQYVANAILLFEHGTRTPLLDAGMARLLRRYFALSPVKADIRYDKFLQEAAYLVLAKEDPVSLNWGILDIAAVHCKLRAPRCENCPLKSGCKFPVSRNRS